MRLRPVARPVEAAAPTSAARRSRLPMSRVSARSIAMTLWRVYWMMMTTVRARGRTVRRRRRDDSGDAVASIHPSDFFLGRLTPFARHSSTPARNSATMATRDLDAAKNAFESADAAASRAAHDSEIEAGHAGEAGKYVKSLVFGGLDGTITTFAVVAASKGGGLSTEVVLLMGFANLVADGISMGFGDYLSSKAELDYAKTEKKREKWELENYPEGEKREMIELYMARGVSEEDATMVIERLAKYKNFFLDLMMVEELGLMPPDETDSPAKNGLVTFCAFALFGFVPLVPYVFGRAIGGANGDALFGSACGLTALTMAALGAAKAKFTNQNVTSSALYMLLNGTLAAASAYLVSFAISKALKVNV